MFDIGDKVKWTSGKILSRGLIYDDNGEEFIQVNCFEINNIPTRRKIKVLRNLLKRDV